MHRLFVPLQLAAALGLLVGVALVLPLGWAVLVDSVLVLALSTALEVVRLRASGARSERRSATTKPGGE